MDLKSYHEKLLNKEPIEDSRYRKLIVSACNAGYVYDAVKYYDQLKRSQSTEQASSHSLIEVLIVLLRAISQHSHNLSRAIEYFQELEKMKRPLDACVFSCISSALSLDKPTNDQVEYYYRKMIECQIDPTVNIYRNFIVAFGLVGNLTKAREIFHMAVGLETPQLHVLYDAMIEVYVTNSMFEDAIKIYEVMKTLGIELSWPIYAKLIYHLRTSSKHTYIKHLYEDCKKFHVHISEWGFLTFLNLASRNDDVEFAKMLLKDSEHRLNIVIRNRCLNALLLIALKANEPQQVFNLFEKFKSRNLTPTTMIYSTLIEASLKLQQPCLALKYWIERKAKDWTMLMSTSNSLLTIYETAKTSEELVKFYEDAKASQLVFDNQMMNLLVQHMIKLGHFDRAFNFYKELLDAKGIPQAATFKALLLASLKDPMKYYPIAVSLCQDAKRLGVSIPNNTGHNTLLIMHALRNDLKSAQTLLRQMNDEKLVPETDSYVSLIECAGRTKDLPMLRHFLESMENQKVAPNDPIYKALIQAFLHCGLANDARLLLSRLIEKKIPISGSGLLLFLEHTYRKLQPVSYETIVNQSNTTTNYDLLLKDVRELWSLFHLSNYEFEPAHYVSYAKLMKLHPNGIQYMKEDLAPHLPQMAKLQILFDPKTTKMFHKALNDYISTQFNHDSEDRTRWLNMLHKFRMDFPPSSSPSSTYPIHSSIKPQKVFTERPTSRDTSDNLSSTTVKDVPISNG